MYKLLLADDSTTIQRVIELTFSGEDIDVVAVGDGEQAIARIPTERPDIVLADIGMPKRSGYEVSAFVKNHAELAHIPVLLLAGAFEPVDEARAAQVRCDGVLVKPFEPQQVIARVHELIEGRKGSPSSGLAGVPRPVERLAPSRGVEAARAVDVSRPATIAQLPPASSVDARTAHAAAEADTPAAIASPPSAPAAPIAHAQSPAPATPTVVDAPAAVALVPRPHPADPLNVAGRMSQAAAFRLPEPRPAAVAPARPAAPDLPPGLDREQRPADVPALPSPSPSPSASPSPSPSRPLVSAMPAADSLDDYFDRLDAAFATLGNSGAPDTATAPEVDDAGLDIPTLDHVLGSGARDPRTETPHYAPAYRAPDFGAPDRVPEPSPAPPAGGINGAAGPNGGRSLLAQAFNALLAVEQGEPAAGLIRLTKESPPPIVTEAMVEEVTRRVLLRLSPDSVRGVVSDIVADIAERLVREEIQRIRNGG